jgi:hypothetical protein
MNMEKNKKRIETQFWGGALLWAGLVLLALNFGLFPQISTSNAWSWILLGAGVLALVANIIRISSADYPNSEAWDYIFTVGFLLGGLSGLMTVNFDLVWPLILILVGGGILVRALSHRD